MAYTTTGTSTLAFGLICAVKKTSTLDIIIAKAMLANPDSIHAKY